MHQNPLTYLYAIYKYRNKSESNYLNGRLFGDIEFELSDDDLRNESEVYRQVFTEEFFVDVKSLFHQMQMELRNKSFDQSQDIINGLSFMQEIIATALWKFNLFVDAELETFARDFDRLDVPEERVRLFAMYQ